MRARAFVYAGGWWRSPTGTVYYLKMVSTYIPSALQTSAGTTRRAKPPARPYVFRCQARVALPLFLYSVSSVRTYGPNTRLRELHRDLRECHAVEAACNRSAALRTATHTFQPLHLLPLLPFILPNDVVVKNLR